MATREITKARLFLFCDRCYSYHREFPGKRAAEREATSHMNLYQHDAHVLTSTR